MFGDMDEGGCKGKLSSSWWPGFPVLGSQTTESQNHRVCLEIADFTQAFNSDLTGFFFFKHPFNCSFYFLRKGRKRINQMHVTHWDNLNCHLGRN